MKKALLLIIVAVLGMHAIPSAAQELQRIEQKPALLVIDMQNIWLPYMAAEDRDAVQKNINELIALFREHDRPIIRVYHTDLDRGPEPNTEPFEFPATIDIKNGDLKVIKNYPSSFTKTDLEKILRENGCNTLFLCGLSATGCVLATYFGGLDREFETVMVQGALLSHKASYTKVIEDICRSMTLEEVKNSL